MCDFVSFITDDVMLRVEGDLLSTSTSFLLDRVAEQRLVYLQIGLSLIERRCRSRAVWR
jgi:hypothetical protein